MFSADKDLYDNIQIYILMNMKDHWEKTLMYRLTKRDPSTGWKKQYKRIITKKFLNKELR